MTKISFMCPHCAGPFQIDDEHTLHPEWQCPYCNQISHFIIQQGELALQSVLQEQPARPVRSRSNYPHIHASDKQLHPSEGESDLVAESVHNNADHHEADLTDHNADAHHAQTEPVPAKTDALLPAASQKEPDSSQYTDAAENENKAKQADDKHSDNNLPEDDIAHLLDRLKQAYSRQQLPLFNSLSRKILEREPMEPSVYAWRAILIEKAGGFGRHTWADPIWLKRMPSQRKQVICQHFYPLTTAAGLTRDEQQRQILADTISQLIADQIIQTCFEAARLQRRRKFSGRFRKKDLTLAEALKQTMHDLNDAVPAIADIHLQNLIWHHLQQQEPQLAESINKHFPWP